MSGTESDGCTYTCEWTICFSAASVQSAQDELLRLFVALKADELSFTFYGKKFWFNEDAINDVRIQTLQEWFTENEVIVRA